jgi:hypothetical protein
LQKYLHYGQIPDFLLAPLTEPNLHFPISRKERRCTENQSMKGSQNSFTLKRATTTPKLDLIPIPDPILNSIDFSLHFELPGKLKSQHDSKVSFDWNVTVVELSKDTHRVKNTLLKIDKVLNDVNVYLLPPSVDFSMLPLLVDCMNLHQAMFVEPLIVDSLPLWFMDQQHTHEPMFIAMDGEHLSMLSILVDFVAEKQKLIHEMGNSLCDTFSDIYSIGRI